MPTFNVGDKVKVKINFHRPSRIHQEAKIIAQRSVGEAEHNKSFQYFIQYEKDGQPDWLDERDLELVEESHEYDEIIQEILKDQEDIVTLPVEEQQSLVKEVDGKKVLEL